MGRASWLAKLGNVLRMTLGEDKRALQVEQSVHPRLRKIASRLPPAEGSLELAQMRCSVARACRVTAAENGRVVAPDGQRVDVEPMPLLRLRALWEYECPASVTLLMRAFLWCALAMIMLSVVSIPQMINNYDRNELRNECRESLAESYDTIVYNRYYRESERWSRSRRSEDRQNRTDSANRTDTFDGDEREMASGEAASGDFKGGNRTTETGGGNETAGGNGNNHEGNQTKVEWLLDKCGYKDLPIRENISTLDWTLLFAAGSCEEYANDTTTVQFSPFYSGDYPFVSSPDSDYCAKLEDREVAEWVMAVGGIFTMVGLLLWLRREQSVVCQARDRAVVSSSDFAVLVSGLPRGKHDDLEAELTRELLSTGFKQDDVVSVVVARDCSRELAVLAKLQNVGMALEEQRVRALTTTKPAEAETTAATAHEEAIAALSEEQREGRAELATLTGAEHVTTGHAIVTFQSKSLRNRFLHQYHEKEASWAQLAGTLRGTDDVEPAWVTADDKAVGGKVRLLRATTAEVAPEPDGIFWEHLELPPSVHVRRMRNTYAVMGLLMAINVAIVCVVKLFQADAASSGNDLHWAVSLVISVCITVLNYLTKLLLRPLTARESHPTHISEELSAFNKLSVVFLCNGVIMPLLVFAFPFGMTQAWYETGGITSSATTLIASDLFGYTFRVVQIPSYIKRYGLGRLAKSQAKLDKCWEPAPHFIGEVHAHLLKSVAAPLVYGALFPPLYLLGALNLLYAFTMCRTAQSWWWRRPPQINDELMQRFRAAIAFCMWIHFSVAISAASKVASSVFYAGAIARLAVSALLWFVYVLAPLQKLSWFVRYNARDIVGDDALRYDEVRKAKGFALEPYECPTLGGPNGAVARGVDVADLVKEFEKLHNVAGWSFSGETSPNKV